MAYQNVKQLIFVVDINMYNGSRICRQKPFEGAGA